MSIAIHTMMDELQTLQNEKNEIDKKLNILLKNLKPWNQKLTCRGSLSN